MLHTYMLWYIDTIIHTYALEIQLIPVITNFVYNERILLVPRKPMAIYIYMYV